MADQSLQTLLSTKAALDLGLVTQADFDAVKNSFLRAQQIKAALDVGLIRGEDYDSAKQEFLGSLVGGTGATLTAAATAPATIRQQPSSQLGGANGSSRAAAQGPPQQQQHQPAPRPPAAQPPARAPSPTPSAVAAAPALPQPQHQPAPAAPGVKRAPSSGALPSNIPKMGGVKSSAGGTSMSGITVSEDAVNLYYLMRLKSTYQWALWQVDDAGTAVVIAAVGEKGSSYQEFVDALPDSDCRYGVFDYQYTTPDGQQLSKLVFLNWAPDSARVKAKMMYASTKDFFKQMLDGISVEFQASELDEIQEEDVAAAVKALKRS